MPAKKKYSKPRAKTRGRGRAMTKYRKKGTRLPIVRVTRPLTMRPAAARQNLVYYNTFRCRPSLAEDGTQQLWGFKMHLTSPWPFGPNWNAYASQGAQELTPNDPITPVEVSGYPYDGTTIIPGMRNSGGDPYSLYSNGVITGSKTTITATALTNSGTEQLQMGYLVARVHSNVNEIPQDSTISDLKKFPFVSVSKLAAGPRLTTNTKSVDARLVIKHSSKRFNNITDYRDNPQLQFKTTPSAADVDSIGQVTPEKDVLSIYCCPALNNYTPAGQTTRAKCTDFLMTMRHEVSVLYSEPRTDPSNPQNHQFPVPAGYGGGFAGAIGKIYGF